MEGGCSTVEQVSGSRFEFARGNLEKLIALPLYLFAYLLSWFVPRRRTHWVVGSGIGIGEGALSLARQLQDEEPEINLQWMVADEDDAEQARKVGFTPVLRASRQGFWATLRAGTLIVTHGLGDVNRYGVFGARIVQLWHGAPLKKLHFDSAVTTQVRGPRVLRSLLTRMYRAGAAEVELYVAGSVAAAERLRSAFRVAPGKVRVLGDPRNDDLIRSLADEKLLAQRRDEVRRLIGVGESEASEPLILYAPTWRDGAIDPAIPNPQEVARIEESLARLGARLIIRSHPLGAGAYDHMLGARIHRIGADTVRDITPLLGVFEAVITDYSSIAIDFALTGRPIVWFAPDLPDYLATRGLYEPLEVTSHGHIASTWGEAMSRLLDVSRPGSPARLSACANTRSLAKRFFAYPEGNAASRVLAELRRLSAPAAEIVPDGSIFFESFYGKQVSCNPLALDREISQRYPHAPRFWSVVSEEQAVPEGSTAVLVGGREWQLARRRAALLIVNDWLRYRFRRRPGQTVLQTWHGTMLKHLALTRKSVGLRTRLAILRESRRWSLLLSQNPHATAQFRRSYGYRGEVLELGYPRDDRLARVMVGESRNPIEVGLARGRLGIADAEHVLVYAPTWRDGGTSLVDEIGVARLAEELGGDWAVVVRGHTRTHQFGTYASHGARIIDASRIDDVNDVIIAATVMVTDYSSVMFDASVARVPQLFMVPDLVTYRDRERGFTFDFESEAPGPLLSSTDEVVAHALAISQYGAAAPWLQEYADRAAAWRERFNPHDDGNAAQRVVDALEARGVFSRSLE